MQNTDRELLLAAIARLGVIINEDGKAPFRLYRRKTRKKQNGKAVYIYYCQFYNPRLKIYETARTTKQTSKAAAYTWAMAHMGETKESNLTIESFASGIFDEGSDYITYREQRGRAMGWNHRSHNAAYLKKYILPYFKRKKLTEITSLDVEDFQGWLLEQGIHESIDRNLSPATANHIVQCFRLIIKWAMRKKLIGADPFVGVEALIGKPRARGTFTLDEAKRMFSLGPEAWPDPLARLLNMTAAACGLRKGELQAIRRKSLQEIELPDGRLAGMLVIDCSWERSGRLKTTKSGKPRTTPLPSALYSEFLTVMAASPWKEPDNFIFYSVEPDKPMSHKKIDKDFLRAVHAGGITEEERKERNLTFHSWRHFCNSFMVNHGIPYLRVQQLIGHTSLKMTGNYLHQGDDFSDVLSVTGKLFDIEG